MSKITLWSRDGHLLERSVRPNTAPVIDGIRRLDADGIGAWIVDTLGGFAGHPVEAIVPVAHGAAVAALVEGERAFLPLDYEQPIPADVAARYQARRDAFAITGSPLLPDGLNIGSQLHWLDQLYPQAMRTATLLPWAQYWAWFLSGVAASEVTSLGCHSDLWAPAEGTFSPMARKQGWADRFAPLKRAAEPVGTLRADLAARTGLPPSARVLAGLHDSNAALLAARGFAEIADNEATILSTGTWFVAMRLPGKAHPPQFQTQPQLQTQSQFQSQPLAGDRDCLINVDAYGQPVPSARFMGGREIASVIGIDARRVDIQPDQPALLAAVPGLVASGTMLLPTLAPGCGPFPDAASRWIGEPADWTARRAAACLYAALVADTALDLIGSADRLLIEGRFAEADVFVRALAALRPGTTIYTASADNDVSFGALRLIDPALKPQGALRTVSPLQGDLAGYRARWQAAIGASA